jgi:hypothetical protein
MPRIAEAWEFTQPVRFLAAPHFVGAFVGSDSINVGADLSADKLQHRHAASVHQNDGADVASRTSLVHIAAAAGTVRRVTARATTAPDGGDKQFTVDVQKASSGSGTWTSLLTGVITFADADSDHATKDGTLIGSPSFVEGDAIRVVVTASGSTGDQGQGVVVTVNLDESGVLP